MKMPTPNLLILKDRSAYGPDEFIEVRTHPFKFRKFTVGALKQYLKDSAEFVIS
jgi:hypothetical protein